jgi:hypothetical protein
VKAVDEEDHPTVVKKQTNKQNTKNKLSIRWSKAEGGGGGGVERVGMRVKTLFFTSLQTRERG